MFAVTIATMVIVHIIYQKNMTLLYSLLPLLILHLIWKPIVGIVLGDVDPTLWIFSDIPLLYYVLQTPIYFVIFLFCVLVLILNYVPVVKKWNRQPIDWEHIPVRGIRWIIGSICLFIAYHFFSADVNLYANQIWLFDRIVLMIISILVFVNPIFVLPFVIYASNYNLQLSIPIGQNSYHHLKFAFQFLTLFGVFVPLRAISKRFEFWHVFVLGIVLVSATYFASGFGKLFNTSSQHFAWIIENPTVHLLAGAHIAYDWLGFLPEDTFLGLLSAMDNIDLFFNLFTIFAEMGLIFVFFRNRKVTFLFLLTIIFFHIGVFITTGLLFRMWLLLDVSLLILLAIQPAQSSMLKSMYKLPIAIYSATAIFTGAFLPQVSSYAWWDVGIYLNFDYQVTTTDGNQYNLPRNFLSPYEDLNRGHFRHFVDLPVPITNNIGAGNYDFWQEIKNLDNIDEITRGIEENGRRLFSEEMYQGFRDFIIVSFSNYNQRGLTKTFVPFLPQIPLHYNAMQNPNAVYYDGQAPVASVQVSYRIDYYNRHKNEFYLIVEEQVYDFVIPQR